MKQITIISAVLLLFALTACGEDDATLTVAMVDAPISLGAYVVEGVYVDINRIDVVKKGSGAASCSLTDIKDGSGVSTVLANASLTNVNLLDLVNGTSKVISSLTLEPGDYLQLRLVVGTNSTIKFQDDTTYYPLQTASGTTSGIKIKGKGSNPLFSISEGDTSELVFDLDAQMSITTSTDKSGYKLSPVIKEIRYRSQTMTTNDFDCEK